MAYDIYTIVALFWKPVLGRDGAALFFETMCFGARLCGDNWKSLKQILQKAIWQIYGMASGKSVRVPKGASAEDIAKLQEYLDQMPLAEVMRGLEFAMSRWRLQDSGALRVGRRGIVNNEVDMVTPEQARWRLANWKLMISNYRRRGYSYPTISRIKGRLAQKAASDK